MLDIERIKRRVRGLLNLADDDAAAAGEIDNALRLAQSLIDKHQLDAAAVLAEHVTSDQAAPPAPDWATVAAPGLGKRGITWEGTLATAIARLVGSVQVYCGRQRPHNVGAFARPVIRSTLVFYGPAEDCRLAADLHSEWATTIATMAVGRYGTFVRKEGALYAAGFARELYNKAEAIHRERRRTISRPTLLLTAGPDLTEAETATALAERAANHSLAAVLDEQRRQAAAWLKYTQGINLGRPRSRRGYTGDHNAYANGRADGHRADFSATRKPKLTG